MEDASYIFNLVTNLGHDIVNNPIKKLRKCSYYVGFIYIYMQGVSGGIVNILDGSTNYSQ
jgi:hypothetical protein